MMLPPCVDVQRTFYSGLTLMFRHQIFPPWVLDADVSTPWEVLERDAEFVPTSVRVLMCRIPFVEIRVNNFFTVECHSNDTAITGDGHLIPFTGGFTSIPGWCQRIVESTTVVVIGRFPCRVYLGFEFRVHSELRHPDPPIG